MGEYKLLVALEPMGDQELGVSGMLFPEEEDTVVYYLVVSGASEIPVLEDGDIELRIYQDAGYPVGSGDDLWEMQSDDKIPSIVGEEYASKYLATAIKMYEESGYTVDHLPQMVMISPL